MARGSSLGGQLELTRDGEMAHLATLQTPDSRFHTPAVPSSSSPALGLTKLAVCCSNFLCCNFHVFPVPAFSIDKICVVLCRHESECLPSDTAHRSVGQCVEIEMLSQDAPIRDIVTKFKWDMKFLCNFRKNVLPQCNAMRLATLMCVNSDVIVMCSVLTVSALMD